MTIERICGNCGSPISGEYGTCPKCPPPSRKKAEAVPALLVAAVLCTSLLMLTSSVVNVVNAPKSEKPKEDVVAVDRKEAAFSAARRFVQERYPGEREYSEFTPSAVEENGNRYVVTIAADEIQGNSVRHFFTVELEYSANGFVLKQISR